MTLELGNVTIRELSGAACISRPDVDVIAASTAFSFAVWIFYAFYLLEHFEHVIFLILLNLLILRLDEQLQDCPDFGLLMPAHLQRLRVIHLRKNTPKHHVRKSQVLP